MSFKIYISFLVLCYISYCVGEVDQTANIYRNVKKHSDLNYHGVNAGTGGITENIGNEGVDVELGEQLKTKVILQSNPELKSKNLQKDFDDFFNYISIKEIKNITYAYYVSDNDMKLVINFTQTNEFIQVRNNIFALKPVQEFIIYLKSIGVNFAHIFNKIRTIWRESYPYTIDDATELPADELDGMDSYLNDVQSILPQDQLFVLFFEKMEESVEFSRFIEVLGSAEFDRHVQRLKHSEQLIGQTRVLAMYGIDLDKISKFIKSLIGWGA